MENGPVTEKNVDMTPLFRTGPSVETHALRETTEDLRIVPKRTYLLVWFFCGILGAALLLSAILANDPKHDPLGRLGTGAVGGFFLFCGVSSLIFEFRRVRVISSVTRTLYWGGSRLVWFCGVPLDRIAAVQVLPKTFYTSSTRRCGQTRIDCEEVNVVLDDGTRINLLHQPYTRDAAERIARKIGCPLWRVGAEDAVRIPNRDFSRRIDDLLFHDLFGKKKRRR